MSFGSRTVLIHILRGAGGPLTLYALSSLNNNPWLALVLFPVAILTEGLSLCWTIGLIETTAMAVHRHNDRLIDRTLVDVD